MYVDKNHPNYPYFDNSHLDIEVWKIEASYGGEIIDCWWEIYEDDVYDVSGDMDKEYPHCSIHVYCCTLRDCPKNVQDDILKKFKDARDQQDYEDIRYYRELY